MIYPKFPENDDLIGIFAPSAGVGHKLESFDLSLDTLHEAGFRTCESASVRKNDIRSASAETRGAELNAMLLDPEIRMLIAASGGEYCNEMLPYVNWLAVRKHPKWILGASDPTNILFPVTTKLDIATMYGCNAGSFDWHPLHRFQTNALEFLHGNIVRQESFDTYDGSRTFSEDGPHLEDPVYWDLLLPDGGTRLDVTGRLIGGCLDCISHLLGTRYDGTKEFLTRYPEESIIWYFDPFQMSAESLYHTLLQMKYLGYFERTAAILFGRVMFTEGSTDEQYLEHLVRLFDVPILWNTDIGHVKPCMTLINGAVAQVTSEDGRGTLEMRLR